MKEAITKPVVPHQDQSFIDKVFTRIIDKEYDSVKDLLKTVGYKINIIYISDRGYDKLSIPSYALREIDFSRLSIEIDTKTNTIISAMVG